MIDLRNFCEALSSKEFSQVSALKLSADEWTTVERITSILGHIAKETTRCQRDEYSLSDFFGGWARIKMELTKYGDDVLATTLLSNMKHREATLFNNQALNAAVFLDPRYQKFMPNQNKERAISFLSKLYEQKESLVAKSVDMNQSTASLSNDEFEAYLSTIYGDSATNESSTPDQNENEIQTVESAVTNIDAILRGFIGAKANLSTTIHVYWQKSSHLNKELRELAFIVHSVPPTQTTVERAFSAMALVLRPQRTNLSDKNLQNMLLLRLNPDLFGEVCEI